MDPGTLVDSLKVLDPKRPIREAVHLFDPHGEQHGRRLVRGGARGDTSARAGSAGQCSGRGARSMVQHELRLPDRATADEGFVVPRDTPPRYAAAYAFEELIAELCAASAPPLEGPPSAPAASMRNAPGRTMRYQISASPFILQISGTRDNLVLFCNPAVRLMGHVAFWAKTGTRPSQSQRQPYENAGWRA